MFKGRRVRLWLLSAVLGLGVVASGWFLCGLHFYNEASAALADDRLADAQDHIDGCLTIWPRSSDAELLAARIARMRDQYRQAEQHLQKLKALEGGSERFQVEWILVRAQAGEFQQLEPELRAYLAENGPYCLLVLETLARCYMREIRYQSAHAVLDDWLQRDPDNPRALDWRGWIRERMDFPAGAFEDYEKALEISPGRWKVRLRLVNMFLTQKKPADAAKHLEILQQTHGQHPEVLLAWGRCKLLQGKSAEALPFFDAVLANDPVDPSAYYYRGQMDFEQGRFKEAEVWFRKTLDKDPSFLAAHFSLYYCLLQQPGNRNKAATEIKSYEAAKKELELLKECLEGLEREPFNPRLLVKAGDMMLRRGNDRLGRQFLVRALDLDPLNRRAHELMISYYTRNNLPQEAAKHRKLLTQQTAQ